MESIFMSRKIYALLCVFIFYSGISPIQADSSKEAFSLHEALTLAYQQNPRVIQARKAIEGAQGELFSVKTWANPEVEAEIGGLRKSEDGSRKGHLDSLSVKQPFDPPGVRSLKKKIGKNKINIQEQILKEVWAEVYVEVRSVYAKLILNKKELELKRGNLKSMRQFFSDVQVRYQSGQALKNHVQRAKIELLKAESDYLKIENDLDIDKVRLNLLLGRKRDVLFEIKDDLKEEELSLNLDQLIDIALSKRPDLKIEETLLDSREKDVTKENLSRLPSYALGFQMIDEEFEKDYAVVIEVSLPLWSFNQGEVKKSNAEREAQEIKVEAMKDEVAFEVYAANKDAQLAIKQLGLYKQSLIEANEMFRLAGLRYGEGHIDFLNYLDQLQASLDSRMRYYQGLYQLNQNINKLEKAIYSSLREEAFLQ
jgi:outer membrane protein TolC